MSSDHNLIKKINSLKKEHNAIILAHNYQIGEAQDVADYLGDSLGLSQKAAQTNADVIVFCGVHFMAETAAILSPDKTVLLPDMHAGCPMADMVNAQQLQQRRKEHPQATIVCYVNSSAAVKAESDYCCTSANAVKLVNSLGAREIIFVPDQYLGHWVTTQTNKPMLLWNGYCHVHTAILPEDILRQKEEHPQAEVMVHPECTPDVIALANQVLSTSGMCRYAKESEAPEIIVGTEIGILHRLKKENPDKKFYPASELAICPNMKLTNLEKILWALEEMDCQVKVPQEIAIKAKAAIDRMLAVR